MSIIVTQIYSYSFIIVRHTMALSSGQLQPLVALPTIYIIIEKVRV